MLMSGDIYKTKNYGALEVLEYINAFCVRYRFVDTGYQGEARKDHILDGNVRDKLKRTVKGVGYIGGNRHKTAGKGGIHTIKYSYWANMIKRCYCNNYQEQYPTYKGCYVCDEWHNFQVFADWFEVNYPSGFDGYHIDKDILIKGNKVYGPDTCKIVSPSENVSHSNTARSKKVSND